VASWLVAIAALLALIGLVAVSPPRPVYDEAWFLDTVRLLERDGLSLEFLREFPGAAGPTFTLVFAAIDRIVGLSFPWLRLVNVALLIATATLIWRCLATAKREAAQAATPGPARPRRCWSSCRPPASPPAWRSPKCRPPSSLSLRSRCWRNR
jgi:hypothetical protein